MNKPTKVMLVRAVLPAAVAAISMSAYAEEQSVELSRVVVSAAGYEQKIVEAPASISVITQEQLRSRPYITLLDAVRDLEGVDVGETRDKTGQGTISIRGMGSDYTLLLINGRRQNNNGDIYPNSFGGNQWNHIPPLDAIERIEVIRGPAATLYGSDAIGGVINIITRRDSDEWSGSVTVGHTRQDDSSYGDNTTTDLYLTGPLIKGVLNTSLRGSWYERNASDPKYSTFTDPAGETGERALGFGSGGKTVDNTNVAGGITFMWTPTTEQTLTFDYDTSRQDYDNKTRINDSGVEEYPLGTVDDYGSMLRVTSGRIEPRAGYAEAQEFTRDAWSLAHEGKWDAGNSFISLSHVATNNNGRTLPYTVDERQELQELWNEACSNAGGAVTTPGGSVVGDRCTVASSVFNNNWSQDQKLGFMENNLTPEEYEALLSYLPRQKRVMESRQYVLDARFDTAVDMAGQHLIVVGGQVIRGELQDGVFGMESGQQGAVQEHNTWSLFAEDTWYVTTPLAVTAGVRYDDHNVFGGETSPRLYAVYKLNNEFTVKGGVTTGYKAPETTDLFDGVIGFGGQGVSPMYGNPNLKPETSISREVALYWEHPDVQHSLNITLFQNDFKDKIASGQPCGGAGQQPCHTAGDFAELGYADGSTRTENIDKVDIHGVEVAGRLQVTDTVALRANYTYTDSEAETKVSLCTNPAIACNTSNPKEEVVRKVPFNNIAEHMANAYIDWQPTHKLSFFLNMELRHDRYRGIHGWSDIWTTGTGYDEEYHGKKLYYKDYELYNLGAKYSIMDNLSLSMRISNLLDRDFTTYETEYLDRNNNGVYQSSGTAETNEILHQDDYNNKESGRSYWLSMNYRF